MQLADNADPVQFRNCHVVHQLCNFFSQARLLSNAQHVEKSAILNITSALKLATTGSSNNRLFAGDLNAATTTLQTVSTLVGKTILDNDGLQEIAKVNIIIYFKILSENVKNTQGMP